MSIYKRTKSDEIDEDVLIQEEEIEEELLLPQATDTLNIAAQYRQIMCFYQSGIDQLTVKLQILSNEFQVGYDRNPIKEISSRVKSPESIIEKMQRKGLPLTVTSMRNSIHDIAGVRVTCPLVSDVYYVAQMLMNQADIQVVKIKDYIAKPKKNGYRSLHLIAMVDVYFSEQKKQVPVEVQIRTIAMDFWASIEHQLKYKKSHVFTEEMENELKICSELMSDADMRMQQLASTIGV